MAATPFRYSPSLADLPKGAERSLIAQFKAIQNDLDAIREAKSVSPVIVTKTYAAKAGELVLLEPPTGGVLVTIPTGNSSNIRQHVLIALVAGVLNVKLAIVGAVGTINGAQTLTMTAKGLLDLVSVGDRGWVVHGSSGGVPTLAQVLAAGNSTGGTGIVITPGDSVTVGGTPGVAGQVFTSGGPGVSPSWAAAAGGGTDPRIFAWFGV